MVSAKDDLLMTVLGCGSFDLEMLEDVRYDFDEIIERLDGLPLQEAGFNGLMRAVVDVGIIHIREAVDYRICELEAIPNERKLFDDEELELAALNSLEPDNDIQSYHNYLDTSVWFEQNGAVYRLYLSEAIEAFEENTGLCIGGGDE